MITNAEIAAARVTAQLAVKLGGVQLGRRCTVGSSGDGEWDIDLFSTGEHEPRTGEPPRAMIVVFDEASAALMIAAITALGWHE